MPHPLDPLSPDEITAVSTAVRAEFASKLAEIKTLKFGYVTLVEPPKAVVAAALGLFGPKQDVKVPRLAEAAIMAPAENAAYEARIDLSSGKPVVTSIEKLAEGLQPGITLEELNEAEEIARSDPEVQKLCADVGVKADQIFVDGWAVGYEPRFPGRRLQQCFVYARFNPTDNLYAHPMDFNALVDVHQGKVIHIDFAAHRSGANGTLSSAASTTHPSKPEDTPLEYAGRKRVPPPTTRIEYLPELLPNLKMRDDIKPLHVVQPEGVSFKLDGNVLEWQKWKLHIGWNYREGLVINTVTYKDNGTERPLFYRLSLAEMVVPYAAPEWPHPRKHAFDVGEYGLGMLANSLALGCDCLGTISYIDGYYTGHDGLPILIKNAICIHEEDAGLLWKHSDFRPGGRAHAVRSRKLVISFICTVANYEYGFYWELYQDGTIKLETKLTGILNIYVLGEGESADKYGTEVAERVLAHHHQHLFSLRVDPMIDGQENSIVESEVVMSEHPTGSAENFAGNAFELRKRVLKGGEDAVRDSNVEAGRMWSFVNTSKTHPASKHPVSYKMMLGAQPRLLCRPDSAVAKRAAFATHTLWTTPYVEGQLFPAGKYVVQSIQPKDAVDVWVKEATDLEQKDIVSYVTFGVTHIPRPEDWPVMPVEHLSISFKPANFFELSPARDVPSVKDIKSVNAVGHSVQANGVAKPEKSSCCQS